MHLGYHFRSRRVYNSLRLFRTTRSIWSKNSDDMAQAWGVGDSGTSNADTILISLLAGQGRVANSLTAASLQGDPSIAKRILITILYVPFDLEQRKLQGDGRDLRLRFGPA